MEDIAAVIDAAGGSAAVYGISSGAVLALDAAARLPQVTRLAVYEPPLVVEPSGTVLPGDFLQRLREHVAVGRRGAAVKQFMDHVGTPKPITAIIAPAARVAQARGRRAHALLRHRAAGRHQRRHAAARGSLGSYRRARAGHARRQSPEWMGRGAGALAGLLGAEHRVLAGQTHMVKPKALAPELGSSARRRCPWRRDARPGRLPRAAHR